MVDITSLKTFFLILHISILKGTLLLTFDLFCVIIKEEVSYLMYLKVRMFYE